jgi:hypothetical protein
VTAAEGAPVPEDRLVVAGKVNFTIMYAAHDAFTRDLRRLTNACTTGRAFTPHRAATWARFKTQQQIHHRAEDVAPTATCPALALNCCRGWDTPRCWRTRRQPTHCCWTSPQPPHTAADNAHDRRPVLRPGRPFAAAARSLHPNRFQASARRGR